MFLASVAAALCGAGSAAAAAATPPVRPHEAAELQMPVRALAEPASTAHSVRYLAEFTPLTGERSVLPIVERRTIAEVEWLRVMLPGRPNNRTGWIHAGVARTVPLRWRIRVDLSNRALAVFRDGHLVHRIRVVVGAAITPSPQGRFFVMERVRLGTSWSRRGWALALSAFSNVLRHFDGGQGQVAIHAKGSLDGALGTAASHGCIRVADREAGWLVARIPRGTVVEIAA